MADIFIGYSKAKIATAEKLAKELGNRGYDVWWDTRLIPTGMYAAAIDAELDAAKAVIVIWSPESVRSKWVRSEATHADRQDKLINTHTSEIIDPTTQIPKPFEQTHSVPVGDVQAIVRALVKLNAPPKGKPILSAGVGHSLATGPIGKHLGRVSGLARAISFEPVSEGTGPEFLLDSAASKIVGRGRGSDIVLLDDSVSRSHAKLEFIIEDQRVAITDMDSTNGTFLNSKRIAKSSARIGDVVTFGMVKFTLGIGKQQGNRLRDEPKGESGGRYEITNRTRRTDTDADK